MSHSCKDSSDPWYFLSWGVDSLLSCSTDATAGFSTAMKDAATQLIWPVIVDEVLSTQDWLASLGQTSSS